MVKTNKLIFISILSLFFFSARSQGDYKLKIEIKDEISSFLVKADLSYEIFLPIDTECRVLPLPFGKDCQYIIDPIANKNIILSGFFPPEYDCGLILLKCSNKPSNYIISFKNVILKRSQTAKFKNSDAISLTIDQTLKRIKNCGQEAPILKLIEIEVLSENMTGSNLTDQLTENNQHKILIPKEFNFYEDEIVLFFKPNHVTRTFTDLLVFLIGAIIGMITAGKSITNQKAAYYVGISSLLIGIAAYVIIRHFVGPLTDMQDSTTVNAIGVLLGLFAGLCINSIVVIYNYNKHKLFKN